MEFTKTLSLGLKTGVQLERCTNTKKGLRQNRYKFSDDAEKYTLNSVVQVLLKRITLQLSFYNKAKWLCDVNEIIRTDKSIQSIADSLGYRKKELFWVFMWRGKDRLIRVIICKVFMDGKKIRNNRFLENKSSGRQREYVISHCLLARTITEKLLSQIARRSRAR